MKKKKGMVSNYLRQGVGLTGSAVVMGSMPTMDVAGAETMKTAGMTGLGHIGTTMPIQGKMIGAAMTFKSIKKLGKFGRGKSL